MCFALNNASDKSDLYIIWWIEPFKSFAF